MSDSPESSLSATLRERIVVADGAMGTMLQDAQLTLDDFDGLEGCNEILNVTRPDLVRSVHQEYFAAGVDCVETNTFGANHTAAAGRPVPLIAQVAVETTGTMLLGSEIGAALTALEPLGIDLIGLNLSLIHI